MIQTICDQIATTIERAQLLDELAASEERLRLALEGADLGSWDVDVHTGAAVWSRCHALMQGYRFDSLPVSIERWRERVHPDDLDRVMAAVERAKREHGFFAEEHRFYRADNGELRWLSLYGRFAYDASGAPLRFSGVSQDITERKQAEAALRDYAEQLQEADERKNEFLATLAHELRNPLAPIRNAVGLLKREEVRAEQFGYAREVLERQLEIMVRLIEDLLDVSRISRGKIELKRGRVELGEIVEQAIETVRPHIEEMGHELEVELPAEAVCLDGDRMRLAQVLSNLLHNACKYSERNGRIALGARVEMDGGRRMVAVVVRDRGIGIAVEHLPRLFESFSQVAGAAERSRGGLGIGLSLVKGLVELHGGTVAARSGGEGKGSEFTVRLPLAEAASGGGARREVSARTPAPADGGRKAKRRRVLVVDDNRVQAKSLAMLLETMGFEARYALDGTSALKLLEEFQAEVALIDIGLPGMSGYELAERLRQLEESSGMMLIAQTGWGREEDRAAAFKAGFDHHLTKPIDHDLLERLLEP